MLLEDKVVIVSGIGPGLGQELAYGAAREGAKIAIAARSTELLNKLKITKQSLNRILRDLIKIDLIKYERDSKDTRVKHVYLNDKGKKIFDEIFSIQKKRIYNALLNSSAKEVVNFNNVLKKIINSNERI